LYSNTAKNIGGIDDHHYLYFIFIIKISPEQLGSPVFTGTGTAYCFRTVGSPVFSGTGIAYPFRTAGFPGF
jgi:hypothetical protein